MMSNTTTIGLHKIIAPSKEQLTLVDGQELAAKYVEPLTEAIIVGTAQIAFLIPEGRAVYKEGLERATILPEFYIGLFEQLFKEVRDGLFPELRPQAARDRIKPVAGTGHVQPEFEDVVSDMFHTPWVTYDPLEQFMRDKVYIGLYHPDGSHTLAIYDEERMMQEDDLPEEDHYALFGFSYKYYKAMDAMFVSNLDLSKEIELELGL